VLANIGLLTPALSSLREEREKNSACVKMRPSRRLLQLLGKQKAPSGFAGRGMKFY
jgi:hypothetical protein